MLNILALDVAKGKSMVTLISSSGEVLINPYEINHSINDFSNLLNRINNLKLENISVIIESTGIYHKPIERFFLENNFKVYTINALSFISNSPHANIISNTRIDCLQNYFKNNNFRYWRRKATLIKEITAYCGLNPSIKQSGKSIDIHGSISKFGNKYMRKLLFISCLNIVRLSSKCHIENNIEIYYRKKRNEGKHHYAAIIACTLNFYVKY